MSRRRRLRALKEWLFGTPPVPVIVRGSLWFARWQARGRIELKRELREAERVASARAVQIENLRDEIRALQLSALRMQRPFGHVELFRWCNAVLRGKRPEFDEFKPGSRPFADYVA